MTRYISCIFSIILLFVSACGESDNKKEADTQITEQTEGIRTINIIGNDNMKYVITDQSQEGITIGSSVGNNGMLLLETISADPGEKIRIRLTNQSQLPASAMAHNFVLLALTADVDAFVQAATQARDNEYIPSDMADQIIAHTGLAAGGETVEVTFTVPEQTGDYPFICSFPGHIQAGMKGTLNVE